MTLVLDDVSSVSATIRDEYALVLDSSLERLFASMMLTQQRAAAQRPLSRTNL